MRGLTQTVDAFVEGVGGRQLRLYGVVGPDGVDRGRAGERPRSHDELDGDPVDLGLDPTNHEPRTVVDGGELVEIALATLDQLRTGGAHSDRHRLSRARGTGPGPNREVVELHVDLDPESAAGLLVGAPAAVAASVALGGREPVEVELLEGATDIGVADRHGVVPLELPGDVRPTKNGSAAADPSI